MPREQKLKVYRTPIGFHDAYVAAPSQKAALEAWGSDADLFARGVAETVTDPELTAEPLASPGKVIRRLRGTAGEHLAALPPEPPPSRTKGKKPAAEKQAAGKKEKKQKPPKPRPDRTPLDEAEQALTEAEARFDAQEKALADEEARLAARRRALRKDRDAELARLARTRNRARRAYDDVMEKWRAAS